MEDYRKAKVREKYQDSLDKARKALHLADHLVYMTFPLTRENRLLLKALEELSNSMLNIINSILQFDYLYKKIQLSQDAKDNFRTFRDKCAKRYGISEQQTQKTLELLALAEKHKQSMFEFSKKDKIVIMYQSSKFEILTAEKLKSFITEAKDMFKKAESAFSAYGIQ